MNALVKSLLQPSRRRRARLSKSTWRSGSGQRWRKPKRIEKNARDKEADDNAKQASANIHERLTPVALRTLIDSVITTEIEGVRSCESKAESLANCDEFLKSVGYDDESIREFLGEVQHTAGRAAHSMSYEEIECAIKGHGNGITTSFSQIFRNWFQISKDTWKPGQVLSANYTDWVKNNVDKVAKTRNDFVRFRQNKKQLDVRLKLASEQERSVFFGEKDEDEDDDDKNYDEEEDEDGEEGEDELFLSRTPVSTDFVLFEEVSDNEE